MKKNILLFLVLAASVFASKPPAERAVGLFFAIGVGPRFPISNFSNSTDLGYGLNLELAYVNSDLMPLFIYAKAGFENFPGSQNFYQITQYSTYSIISIPLSVGGRYYFKPLMENVILFIPMVEASLNFNNYSVLHQFKGSANRANYNSTNSKLGISAGIGFSTFLIELLGSYNYYKSSEYLSIDLKVRLPLIIVY